MSLTLPAGMEISGEIKPGYERILAPEARALVAKLARAFAPRRQELLAARAERAQRLDAGERPDSCPIPPLFATATGASRRFRRPWHADAWKLPARWSARWSSMHSIRAQIVI